MVWGSSYGYRKEPTGSRAVECGRAGGEHKYSVSATFDSHYSRLSNEAETEYLTPIATPLAIMKTLGKIYCTLGVATQ